MGFTMLGTQPADVLQGGQVTLTQMFETFPGSGQQASASGVTVGITAAPAVTAGQGTPLAPTSAGIVALSASLYQYTFSCPQSQAPGDYLVTWSGAVGGQPVRYVQALTVAAPAQHAPAPGVYATIAQYQAWSGDQATPIALIETRLMRASEDIDNALIGAVYATDGNGMPTDPMLLNVLARATCAQAQWLNAENDDAGIKRQYSSVSMGGVSQARAAAMTGNALPPLSPRAAQILHTAGVLPSAALINW